MNFFIRVFGCKTNQYEAEIIREGVIVNKRDCVVDNVDSADIVILKSCVVTGEAERKVLRYSRSILKRGKKLWLVGCISKSLRDRLGDNNNISVFSNNEIKQILNLPDILSDFRGKTRAFVKIQDGCNNYCTYCIIPYMRPLLWSKPIDIVKKEIDILIDKGFKEIVLTGTHIGLYNDNGRRLIDLLNELRGYTGRVKIRLGSLNPDEIDTGFIPLMNEGLLQPHIHISLQSGSNRILRLMGRDYTRDNILKIADVFMERVRDIGFSGDVIVGFPDENERDFLDTIDIIKRIRPLHTHIFPFSFREGTRVLRLKGRMVSDVVIRERMVYVNRIRLEIGLSVRKDYIGKVLNVLVEKCDKGMISGHSGNYIFITKRCECDTNNKIIPIKIVSIDEMPYN